MSRLNDIIRRRLAAEQSEMDANARRRSEAELEAQAAINLELREKISRLLRRFEALNGQDAVPVAGNYGWLVYEYEMPYRDTSFTCRVYLLTDGTILDQGFKGNGDADWRVGTVDSGEYSERFLQAIDVLVARYQA